MNSIDVLKAAWTALTKPGLEKITRRIVRRHYSKNTTLQDHRYGALRTTTRWIKSHPMLSVTMLAVSYCLTAGLSLLLYPLEFGPRVPVNIEDFYRDLQAINFTILAAQATFVGLVFPIVIALVGLLSEGKISYRGRLNLFLEESEATFVGTSALVLIATLLVQALVLSQLPERVGAALTGLNIFWFACNVYAIGFFLFQTLRYVQPDLRFEIEKRYIANVVWRDQLTSIIRRNRWGNAQHYGYWPKPENIVGDRDEAPLIITQRFHEPPRVCRRLLFLRDWSDDRQATTTKVLHRGARARGSDGDRAWARTRLTVGRDCVDCHQDWMRAADIA